MKQNSSLSEKGFSLIEILVALGILGAVMASMATLIFNQRVALESVQVRQDLLSLTSDLQNTLLDPVACETALGTLGVAFDSALAALPTDGLPFELLLNGGTIASGNKVPGYQVIADQFQIIRALPVGTLGTADVFKGDLILKVSSVNSSIGGLTAFRPRNLGSAYFTVETGRITSCSSKSPIDNDQIAETCDELGGSFELGICDLSGDIPKLVAKICPSLGGAFADGKCTISSSGGSGPGSCRGISAGPLTRARSRSLNCSVGSTLQNITWIRIMGGPPFRRDDIPVVGAVGSRSYTRVRPDVVYKHTLRGECCSY